MLKLLCILLTLRFDIIQGTAIQGLSNEMKTFVSDISSELTLCDVQLIQDIWATDVVYQICSRPIPFNDTKADLQQQLEEFDFDLLGCTSLYDASFVLCQKFRTKKEAGDISSPDLPSKDKFCVEFKSVFDGNSVFRNDTKPWMEAFVRIIQNDTKCSKACFDLSGEKINPLCEASFILNKLLHNLNEVSRLQQSNFGEEGNLGRPVLNNSPQDGAFNAQDKKNGNISKLQGNVTINPRRKEVIRAFSGQNYNKTVNKTHITEDNLIRGHENLSSNASLPATSNVNTPGAVSDPMTEKNITVKPSNASSNGGPKNHLSKEHTARVKTSETRKPAETKGNIPISGLPNAQDVSNEPHQGPSAHQLPSPALTGNAGKHMPDTNQQSDNEMLQNDKLPTISAGEIPSSPSVTKLSDDSPENELEGSPTSAPVKKPETVNSLETDEPSNVNIQSQVTDQKEITDELYPETDHADAVNDFHSLDDDEDDDNDNEEVGETAVRGEVNGRYYPNGIGMPQKSKSVSTVNIPFQGVAEEGNAEFVKAEDTHFFAYFMTMIVLCIIGYLVFHNKQKILALALEGRSRRGTRRRPNTSGYRKLDSNLEEAVTSQCSSASVTHVIY